jgi:hypothetical protein
VAKIPLGGFKKPGQLPGITDGTSNTVFFSEKVGRPNLPYPKRINNSLVHQRPGGVAGITDGTSNTIMFGETQPTGSITDGTSNTIMFGELPPTTSITDGTSNTIMLGERIPGMSHAGACEALRGSIVNSYEDRKHLANGLLVAFGDGSVRSLFGNGSVRFLKDTVSQTAFDDGSVRNLSGGDVSLILPAVRAIYEAAGRIHPSLKPSFAGTVQLLSGEPVCNPHDRMVFAFLLAFLIG